MNTEYQYMFMSSPPEREANFQQLKKKHGSIWAFHGSPFGNWHSILRIGLKNFSKKNTTTLRIFFSFLTFFVKVTLN